MSVATEPPQKASVESNRPRVVSIDALRGLVMFTMIFVNDLAGVSHKIVPDWMRHFHGKSGMTFVDMVFPGFLFIVGMSIPFALGGRLRRGEPLWKILLHIVVRTISLMAIGIMMVNDEEPGADMSGLSPTVWAVSMYVGAMLAFCSVAPPGVKGSKKWQAISWVLRSIGMSAMLTLALMFRGDKGQRILTLSPFAIHTSWYGILGLIGWAYLVGSIVYLLFRGSVTALLASMVLLLCFYPADKAGFFDGFFLSRYVGMDGTIGTQPSITVGGIIVATVLVGGGFSALASRVRFILLFIAGCAAGALLINGLYGVNKNEATPSWCLWACVFTGALALLFHLTCDGGTPPRAARILAIAGSNVLLAYLLSEMTGAFLDLIHLGDWYGALGDKNLFYGIARSAGCGVVTLAIASGLNRLGFRMAL